jgi:hypothetical protein
MLVVGTLEENAAAAEYWSQLGRLQAIVGPYTLWNDADLDTLVQRWDEGLGARARALGTRAPATISYMLESDRDGVRGERCSDETVECIARSLARMLAGDKPTVADAGACTYRSESAVRTMRMRWLQRLARSRSNR